MKAFPGRGAWVLLTLALAAGGFFWLSQSSVLAIDEIEIEGNHAITSEEVMQRAGHLLKGESLLKPSYDDVRKALVGHPFVESVEIDRDFPHKARIMVREYRPFVNLSASDNQIFILSVEGRTLARADGAGEDLPRLSTREPCSVEIGSAAECSDVLTGLRFLAGVPMNFNLEIIEVTVSDGDITLRMKSGVTVHFGSPEEYGLKFEVMRQLLARSGAGAQVSIDVSVPQRPVTKDSTPATTTSTTAEEEPDVPAVDEGAGATAGETGPAEDAPAALDPGTEETVDAAAGDPGLQAAPETAADLEGTGYEQTE